MGNHLAIDIGGTQFRVALFDGQGQLLETKQSATSHSGGREWMLGQLRGSTDELRARRPVPVRSCGVSFGGPVDFKRQSVSSVHTPGWKDFALSEWIETALRLPCRVDNDANCGALGEHRFGAGRGAESMVYLTMSTGIGSGIICSGQVHRGRDSMAGEIGHLPLTDSETLCTCGLKSGCTEALASGRALGRKAQEFAAARPKEAARLLELSRGKVENLTARELALAAQEGDPGATAVFTESVRWLARALLMAIRLLDPDKIVLGGGVAQAGGYLLNCLEEALEEWWSPSFPYSTQIVLAELGAYSPLYGAAALALDV